MEDPGGFVRSMLQDFFGRRPRRRCTSRATILMMGRRATTSGARAARTSTATAPRRTTTTTRTRPSSRSGCAWATTSTNW